ncbi:MAG: dihydropteroate synthase, partial [Lachnospiraceae bacterium]|nr:dihydropteroate synthase [Lachnospiraceae bacterium]
PNAGLPRSENGRTVYDVGPEEFSDWMVTLASMGIQVAGGCCGTTPDHIRRTIEKVSKLPFKRPLPRKRTVVTSFSRAVEIGPKPVIIGERINPTGKKKFKEALRRKDIEYILSEGLRQEDAGAHILDVNVGLPEIDEPEMMESVVKGLQSVTDLPLQIDTSDPAAMERGMRLYNGKPMVNSVSGKRESIEAVMPLVAKYGGVLVGLALDEEGIPDTADGRIRAAEKIYAAADEYGIPREDIVIDGLAMTISSDTGSARVTLETLKRIRDDFGGHTILGVSNISFGLPRREIINSHFLTMAMTQGLSCAIINPGNEAMMQSYRAFLALQDMDGNCMGYIDAYAGTSAPVSSGQISSAGAPSGKSAAEGPMGLGESIERGMTGSAEKATRAALESRAPMEIINEDLIPALDRVGQGFEKGTVFLPQLLMSAEAAKAAFEVIKEKMSGTAREVKGRIILATVKGDIHDIGKNIVKVMLENYGYDILDLGKDVAPETIVETAIREKIRLVGLSALMTTTLPAMEETIRQLHQLPDPPYVFVGGAVVTPEYAQKMGA